MSGQVEMGLTPEAVRWMRKTITIPGLLSTRTPGSLCPMAAHSLVVQHVDQPQIQTSRYWEKSKISGCSHSMPHLPLSKNLVIERLVTVRQKLHVRSTFVHFRF